LAIHGAPPGRGRRRTGFFYHTGLPTATRDP